MEIVPERKFGVNARAQKPKVRRSKTRIRSREGSEAMTYAESDMERLWDTIMGFLTEDLNVFGFGVQYWMLITALIVLFAAILNEMRR
jgi:hypothetical protein